MRKISQRSHASMNRIHSYNMVDAKLDNPHLTIRELPAIVKEANGIKRAYTPLRRSLRKAM